MSRLFLVTGGAGFIGSHLVDALLARGDCVRVLDDFSTGRRENLAHCLGDVELLEGDVRDLDLVARAVTGCDGVFHEAAVASVTRSLADPVDSGSVTHGGTVNVFTQARRGGVGAFVLASSCAVYGDAPRLPISEETPPRPLSPYALAKLLSEEACGARRSGRPGDRRSERSGARRPVTGEVCPGRRDASAGVRAVCLRYFNVYGPRQDPSSEYSGVIARFMDVAVRRAAARAEGPRAPRYVVYGDGRQTRDFVYVSDVVAANLLALDACLDGATGVTGPGEVAGSGVDGLVLNIGSGTQASVLDIVAAVERVAREGGAPVHGGRPRDDEVSEAPIDWRPPREGDIRASQADVSRARAVLGYEPTVSFAEGLAATYEWYAGRDRA